MEGFRSSHQAILRYTLFQLPGIFVIGAGLLLLRHWVGIPTWAAWGIFALWIVKDVALFPFLWRSYCTSPASMRNSLVGQPGIAREDLAPAGRVRIGGELWNAEGSPGCGLISAGSAVTVREVKGLTLIVEPLISPETP